MLRKVGQELHEIYKTGSALVTQGCNRLLDTSVGKKVSEVTSPVFVWVKERTPESVKNKSFVYGAGAVLAVRIPMRWWSNTPNNHLEQAAKHYDNPTDAVKAARIRAEKV